MISMWFFVISLLAESVLTSEAISFTSLPNSTVFPGPWESYIQAPTNRTQIRPKRVYSKGGDVVDNWADNGSIAIGPGGYITFEFSQNIGGRVLFNVDPISFDNSSSPPQVAVTFSESSTYIGEDSDATDMTKQDLPLHHNITKAGVDAVGEDFVRGGFKYLRITNSASPCSNCNLSDFTNLPETFSNIVLPNGQCVQPVKPGLDFEECSKSSESSQISFSDLWVNFTAAPSNPNPRAYTGYFNSSSALLNRIWYAGAYTLQLSTIDPREGGAILSLNRIVDKNNGPLGAWWSNFTIANGTTVTTDGAKRDRMAWPGDMLIASPGIAMSTYDLLAIRNALDSLFAHQYADGGLPYAGPPMGFKHEYSDTYHMHTLLGVWNYILYGADIDWLEEIWPKYLRALNLAISRIDDTGLYHVVSTSDWLRPGMTGHNIEATSILYYTLQKALDLSTWLESSSSTPVEHGHDELRRRVPALDLATDRDKWTATMRNIEGGISALYCPDFGLFADNIGNRSCNGIHRVLPQDGNSFAVLSGLAATLNTSLPSNISSNLKNRWTPYGAPAVEFPGVISPFASGFELIAHCAANETDTAVQLMQEMWGYMLNGHPPDGEFTGSTLVEGYSTDGRMEYAAYSGKPSRNSHAHGWSSGPTMVLMNSVVGIELTGPGGETWIVKPGLPDSLDYVQGGFATVVGKFEAWACRVSGGKEFVGNNTPEGTSGKFVWGGESVDIDDGDTVWEMDEEGDVSETDGGSFEDYCGELLV